MKHLLGLADWMLGRFARRNGIIACVIAAMVMSILISVGVAQFDAVANGLPMIENPALYLDPSVSLTAIVHRYPPEANRVYRNVIQPLDIVFPLSIGLLFGTALYMLITAASGRNSAWRAFALVGPGLTLLDYLENIGVGVLLRASNPPAWIEPYTRIASLLKALIGTAAILSLVVLLVRHWRGQHARQTKFARQ